MGMREVVLAALVGALIVIAAVAVPALALESPGFHAVVYPVALALFVPYAWLTLPAVLKEGHEMTALYALFVSMAIVTVWAIGELSGRSIGRMRLIVLEGALVSVMALSFASVLISLGVTNTLILSSPLAVAAMIYIVAALVGIVPPEGVEAGISDNAATASIPSNIEVETIISREEGKEQTQTPPSVEIHENLPTICIENTEEETPSIPAIIVPEEAGEEPVPAINCEAEAPATAEEAAITEEPLIIAEEEAPAPVVIEEEPIPAEPAIITEEEAIPAETVAIIKEETIPAESAPAEEIVIEEPVEEVLIEEEPAIIEPEVIAEAVIEEPSPAEEIAEPVIVEEEEIIPVEEDEPVLVEDAEPAIIEEEPAPIATAEEPVQIPRPPAITVSSRLSVPTAPTLTNTAKLEEPRVPSAPSLSNTAELVEEDFGVYAPKYLEDDFWSTFYIAGEDDLLLDDGLYYMTLYINGTSVGSIRVQMTNGDAALFTADLREYIEGNITDEAEDRIFFESGEFIDLSYLASIGVENSIDTNSYAVYLTFDNEDMPIQILSLRPTGSFATRPIAGALNVYPAAFTWSARYTLSLSFGVNSLERFVSTLRGRFTVQNYLRLYDVYGSFSYYLDYYNRRHNLGFSFGSYNFRTDFEDQMIRLSWGNISTDLLSPDGTTVGIRFDKSLSYASPGTRGRSHIERMLIVEKESEVVVYNEGREIFRRTLQPGNYRLQDFVLYTGANKIRIVVTPLDGSEVQEMDIDVNYSSMLLPPGDVYYGGSIATGRKTVMSSSEGVPGSLRIPLWGGRSLEYDWRNIVFSGYIRSGLTESLTFDTSLALRNTADRSRAFNPDAEVAFELTHANTLGVTRYNLNVTELSEDGAFTAPNFYLRLSHQMTTGMKWLSAATVSATYDGDFFSDHRLSASASVSGRVGIVSWGLSGFVSSDLEDLDGLSWNISNSYSMSLGRNFFISGAIDLSASGGRAPSVGGRVTATVRFGSARAGAGWNSSGYTYANFGAYSGRHSFDARIDTMDLTRFDGYSLSADYSYSGDYINASAGLSADDLFRDTSLDFQLSTSTVFADGLFAVTSAVPTNYLLVHQGSGLKGNELSVGSAGSSAAEVLPSLFGTSLYRGVSTQRDTSLSLYSVDTDSFGNMSVFDITLPRTGRLGYVLRLEEEETYTVSGIVEGWLNSSSPLYAVSLEEGNPSYTVTEDYVFTDSDGRFIVSGFVPGLYSFDVQSHDGWLSYMFSIPDDPDLSGGVILLDDPAHSGIIGGQTYTEIYMYENSTYMTPDSFWSLLYPTLEEAV